MPSPVGLDALRRPLAELPDPLPIPTPVSRPGAAMRSVLVRPPGSKSLTNRALLLAGLADGESVLRGALTEADDAQRMIAALGQLGASVDVGNDGTIRVRGVGGRWKVGSGGASLFLNNAGTATRFLAAAALAADGPVTIDGNERMRQRPIGELVEALRGLGAKVEELGAAGCPPIRITPPPEDRLMGAEVKFGVTQSSQFISALLLTAVALPDGLTVTLGDEITSASYVEMTVSLLQRVGVHPRTSAGLRVVRVPPGLRGFDLEVEPDASGATYFWAAGALVTGMTVGVTGLGSSTQGDAGFAGLMGRAGAGVEAREEDGGTISVTGRASLRPMLADMSDMPDAAVTLAVVASFASGTSVLRGVRTLRVKETDRIEALRVELSKIGVVIETDVNGDPGTMTVTPPAGGVDCSSGAGSVRFRTYDDHRMAMALSLVGLRRPGVLIEDPKCVAKTYPRYFAEFSRLLG